MLFNVLSPFVYSMDAKDFSDAAKQFVTLQRNRDITRLILADRFKNAMRADIAYTLRNGNLVAGISLSPTVYPTTIPYPGVVTTSPTMPYPVGIPGVPVQPAGLVRTTSDGQQVFPVRDGSIGVAGVNVDAVGVNPLGLGYPSLAHGPSVFTTSGLNKVVKK